MNLKRMATLLALSVTLAGTVACSSAGNEPGAGTETTSGNNMPMGGMGRGMGPGNGMMERHSAAIPEEYSGLSSPQPADDESIARGEAVFELYCETCHGESGLGDGPGGANLDPAPAPVAHTSLMLGDDYLFWRISEGGGMEPFNSAMPSWENVLEEGERWDVINYVRALGSGTVPGRGPMAGPNAQQLEAEQRAEMLVQAVEQGVLTQEQADLFDSLHARMDELATEETIERQGGMETMRATLLGELVDRGEITESEASAFEAIHALLQESGLME